MFTSASPEERTAAFEYMKYLTSPEAQKHGRSIPATCQLLNLFGKR